MASRRVIILCAVLVLALQPTFAHAKRVKAAPTTAPARLPPDNDVPGAAEMLGSGDPAVVAQAAKNFRASFETILKRRFPIRYLGFLQQAIDANQTDMAHDLAFQSLVERASYEDGMEACLYWMAEADIAAGKGNAALAEAKSLYSVCPMDRTKDAIDLVCDCLYEVHKADDVNIARRFRAQQVEGTVAASATQPAQLSESPILGAVVIDPTPYERWIEKAHFSGAPDANARYINLLLVSGQASKAEAICRKMMATTNDRGAYLWAVSGVARSLRAEDGTVGRANQFILSLNQQGGNGGGANP